MSNKNSEEAELPVIRPSYRTWMKFTKFKTVAYKLVQFSSHLLIHCLFICLLERGLGLCCEYPDGAVGILRCEQPTALQTMICFSRAEQLHDSTLSFTFLVHSCQLTQQHEVANPVLDPVQLCLLLQWWCYKALHRHYQREKWNSLAMKLPPDRDPKHPSMPIRFLITLLSMGSMQADSLHSITSRYITTILSRTCIYLIISST